MLTEMNNHIEAVTWDCHIWQNKSSRRTKIRLFTRYIFLIKIAGDLDTAR